MAICSSSFLTSRPLTLATTSGNWAGTVFSAPGTPAGDAAGGAAADGSASLFLLQPGTTARVMSMMMAKRRVRTGTPDPMGGLTTLTDPPDAGKEALLTDLRVPVAGAAKVWYSLRRRQPRPLRPDPTHPAVYLHPTSRRRAVSAPRTVSSSEVK